MVTAAHELHALFSDLGNVAVRVKTIETIERRADEVTHTTVDLLHKTFVTPFDRDQIHLLVSKMDDCVDMIEDVAQTLLLYDVRSLTPEAQELSEMITGCTGKVKDMVALLPNMGNGNKILAIANEIKTFEEKSDYVMRAGVAKLFRNGSDPRELIKMKEVYELLETVTDRCDDVADIAKSVVLENA